LPRRPSKEGTCIGVVVVQMVFDDVVRISLPKTSRELA
jgi:hypothetical protein